MIFSKRIRVERNFCEIQLPDTLGINKNLVQAFQSLREASRVRGTHFFHGRFENIYINEAEIPQLQKVTEAALWAAGEILDEENLKYGFWFNEMGPGQKTSRHNHDELDELLSCVYYITAPEHSGDLRLYTHNGTERIVPEPGKFIFFDPMMDHEVEINQSDQSRLSVAFNFGPAD